MVRVWMGLSLALALACGDDDGTMAADAGADAFVPADLATPDDAEPPEEDASTGPTLLLPRTAIQPEELAILVNDDDAQSVALADAYVAARAIPAANVVHLSLPTGAVLSRDDFAPAYAAMEAALPDGIQALLITWTQPFRVDCMSVTSAFALGFDETYCNTTGMACGATAPIDYFDSASTRPFDDHAIRPAMMLAAADQATGEALIARGVAADDTFPDGDGYLVRTTDTARSVRHPTFPGVVDQWDHAGGLGFTFIDNSDGSDSNVVMDATDVLFYFTGLARVAAIETNEYRPGAIADHLTSFGGRVPTSGQMSIAEWLAAGVTGSYGTVVEPCNYQQKFPAVPVVVERYFRGETLLEAYWKSVRWPGEGLFVGDPLARPFGAQEARIEGDRVVFETNAVVPGEAWAIQSADDAEGPWTTLMDITVDTWQRQTVSAPLPDAPFIRLARP